MKRLLTLLAAGCILSCAQPQPAAAQEFKTHVSKEFSLKKPASASTLCLYNISGNVKVEGYAGDKVLIEVDLRLTAKSEEYLEEGKKEFRLEFEDAVDTLTAYIAEPYDSRPNRQWRRNWDNTRNIHYRYNLNFTVKVPYAMNLNVSTVNEGDVSVKDVTGSLSVHNVNGDIAIANAKDGAINASTVNGDVIVNHISAPPSEARYHTINGKLDITYPANLSADLSFKSMNGSFYTDFEEVAYLPIRVTKTEEKKASGTIYKLNKGTDVRIGNGGKSYRFETLNGNVYIKKQS
jgi:hypothetical protein